MTTDPDPNPHNMQLKSRVIAISALLILSAFLLVLLARQMDVTGEVLQVPLSRQVGEKITLSFTVPIAAQCRIGVRCSRRLPFGKLRALLQQGNLVDVQLLHGTNVMPLHYFAPANSDSVDSTAALANLNFGHNSIEQDIAYFSGESKRSYLITYTVIRPIGELAATNPTFIVYFDPREAINRGFIAIGLEVLAFVLGFLGVVVAVNYVFFRKRFAAQKPVERM